MHCGQLELTLQMVSTDEDGNNLQEVGTKYLILSPVTATWGIGTVKICLGWKSLSIYL